MLAERIIACLDVKNGRVVKGTRFEGLKDAGEPAQLAAKYASEGADEVVFLDITASNENRSSNKKWVGSAAKQLNVPFTVGGGISSLEDIQNMLYLGADKVSVNTAALQRPELISIAAQNFGSQCVVAAIDAKREGNKWKVYSHGGKKPTGLDALDWAAKCEELGAGEILLTSIDSDGTRQGFDFELTRSVAQSAGIPVIASGGAGSMKHFLEVFTYGKADAALAAGTFHYGELSIGGLKKYLAKNGIAMRLK